jgi:hypothetical protein
MKQKLRAVEKQPKQKLVALRYLAMPSLTIEGHLFTTQPYGDHSKTLNDLKTLIETKISTSLQSMVEFLKRSGVTIGRLEIATTISYDKPAMPVKKNGKDN